ncbi:MAG: hypothetical protein KGJ59_12430, partial [Bacteroidota bacterium]|nr:hypothetical protein [Bacteroidota bacterium]
DSGPVINIVDGNDIVLRRLKFDPKKNLLLSLEGKKTGGIIITNTDVSNANNDIRYGKDVSPNAVTIR